VNRCVRCRRRLRKSHLSADCQWNAVTENGVITGIICPTCQTPQENAEAAINEATLAYSVRPDGRLIGRPKAGA